MKKFVLSLAVVLLLAAALMTAGCAEIPAPPQQATGGASIVTDLGYQVPKNAQGHTTEQQNIIDRIKVTDDPNKVMWIHLITLEGKIIRRMPVAHKVTSSGKRLEPMTAGSHNEYGYAYPKVTISGKTYETVEFIQPDGTYGSSDNYIFWFDTQHRYHQWGTAGGLGYLLTDYPIDLTNPQDLVTSMYNTDQAAYQWQKLQEQQMCQTSGKTYDAVKMECK